MSRWREVKFGEVVELSQGLAINMQSKHLQTNDETQLPLLRIADMKEGTKSRYISKEVNEKFVAKPEDIIYTRTGQVGLVFKGQNGVIHNNCFKVMPCEKTVNRDFLYWILKSNYMYSYVNILASGAAQPDLTHSKFKNIKIQIPDLETQKKIADILSTYDELIENNNRRIEILEKTAEEIYKEWFVRMRFPGHENTRFEKGIPEGWEVKKIGDITKFKRGKNLRIADAIEGSVPVIAGGIEPSCYHNESNTKAPVITVSASGANAGYTKLNYVDVWASDCSYIDIEDTNLIYYIYLLLKVSHKEIMNLQTGSAQPHVYAKDLNDFKFLKPSKKLALKINEYARDNFENIRILILNNQNLAKQRDLLLPRLMNGTIEVK